MVSCYVTQHSCTLKFYRDKSGNFISLSIKKKKIRSSKIPQIYSSIRKDKELIIIIRCQIQKVFESRSVNQVCLEKRLKWRCTVVPYHFNTFKRNCVKVNTV